MDAYIEVTSDDFEETVLKSDVPVIVDFWAGWCGPCKAFAPIFADTAAEYAGRVKFCKLDVDESQDIAREYGVMSIPSILIFKNGKVVVAEAGMRPKAKLIELIDRSI